MVSTRRQFLKGTVAGSGLASLNLASIKSHAAFTAATETGLKDLYAKDFKIGTAISGANMRAADPKFMGLIAKEFNAITMENNMKWERLNPEQGKWDWEIPDKFMAFGASQNMYILGHVLVWHSQVPDWVFKNPKGKDINARKLKARMVDHIEQLAGRYKGKISAWDVLNEAVDEGNGWRKSPWFNIIGPKFVDLAFNTAHEIDPNAHLIYNDYNMHNPDKRDFVVKMVRDLKKRGVPIQGIGMQGHVALDYPSIKELEDSIKAFAAEGMRVHITELDVDVLPAAWDHIGAEISTNFEYSDQLNPYIKGLPAEIEAKLASRYSDLFKLFLKYRDDIERVTFWGTGDKESWKNDFPVRGRTNYPLLFDREYKRKPCYDAVAALKK